MARKLYVRLQQPTIELTVVGIDGGGKKASVLTGFKRYKLTEASTKLKELDSLRDEVTAQVDSGINDADLDTSKLDAFIQDNIQYFLNEELVTEDENGKIGKLKIKDTRLVTPEEDFWDTPEECKNVILAMYLDSLAWRMGFSSKLQDALVNTKFDEDELKN